MALDSAQGGLGYKGKQNGGVPRAKWPGQEALKMENGPQGEALSLPMGPLMADDNIE